MASIRDRFRTAWNAFTSDEQEEKTRTFSPFSTSTASYGGRQDRGRTPMANERSIINSIYTRLAIDAAAIPMLHVKTDEDGKFKERMKTGLNECLTVEANLDQGARAFRQDMFMTMMEEGVIAIVPTDTSDSPKDHNAYDIYTLRVGKVVEWRSDSVRVELYNEKKAKRQEITLPKTMVALAENPLYSVMNESNSTLNRLKRKLAILDAVDEQAGSGKLDLIIQLPYVIKSDARRQQAEERRKDIEVQLKGSKYGIAYTDGTERITQLNRPAENNMLGQIEFLTDMLYSQLGLTEEVFNGTATESVMLNYHNRTIEPITAAVTEAMKRTFLTKTARSQFQSVECYRDPFKYVTISSMAELADKFTRNEILTSNEIRGVMGLKPSTDPKAEELRNKNLPEAEPPIPVVPKLTTPIAPV